MAASYDLVPDPWQTAVLRDWLRSVGGMWASSRCGLSVPRQNGKNAVLEVRELYGMIALGERFLHTAHEVKTARKAFQRLKHFFGEKVADAQAQYPELNALVKEVRNTNGQEAIVLRNGGSVEFVARSKGSGRGFSVDVLVCDEAQELSEDELAALRPTISASPNPQVILTGTPPKPVGEAGEVFIRMRTSGVNGGDGRLAWSEYSCDDDLEKVDLDSRQVVAETNPAYRVRLLEQTIIDERADFGDEAYARERLGWWQPGNVSSVIQDAAWASLADPESKPLDPVVFAVAVTPGQDAASISISGRRADGLAHVEVVDSRDGTGWVVDRLAALAERWSPAAIVVDGSGPAGSLLPSLNERGVDVTKASMSDYAQGCGAFYDAVVNRQLRHLGDPVLSAAVRAGRKRPLADRWAWGRKGAANITPLEAATLALWALPAHRTYDLLESIV